MKPRLRSIQYREIPVRVARVPFGVWCVSAVVLALVLLSPIPLMWLLFGSLRLAKLHRDVHLAWMKLETTLKNRHDALDSVRRVCRRNALDSTLGVAALSEAQSTARSAMNGERFEAIVAAERELDRRVFAFKGVLEYQSVSSDLSELSDLVACLDLLNSAVARATADYNRAVDTNNFATQERATAWLACATGRHRAFAFRARAGTSDYQLIA